MNQKRRVRMVVVTGSASAQSRSKILGDAIALRVQTHLATDMVNVEIGHLVPEFGAVKHRQDVSARVESALQQIKQSDLLVVATPVFKGSYSGHFKHLFDLVDARALIGTPVALAAIGGGERHGLMVEHQLRPLLGFFHAQTRPTAIYATKSDIDGGAVRAEALLRRIEAVAVHAMERLTLARLATKGSTEQPANAGPNGGGNNSTVHAYEQCLACSGHRK